MRVEAKYICFSRLHACRAVERAGVEVFVVFIDIEQYDQIDNDHKR